jgi:hypothetical protein
MDAGLGSLLGGLVSGASSLFGGILGDQQSASNTASNIAEENFQAGGGNLSSLVSNAKAAGLSPLAVLGQTNPGSPVAVGDNSLGKGIADAGQDIGRSVTAYMDPSTKADVALKMAQTDNLNADTAGKMRRTFAAPGSPPGLPVKPDGTLAHPFPLHAYYGDPGEAPVMGQSKDFANSSFGWGSIPSNLAAGAKSFGEMGLSLGRQVGSDLSGIGGDVYRSIFPPAQ